VCKWRPEGWYGITKTYVEATGYDGDHRFLLAEDRIQFQVSLNLAMKTPNSVKGEIFLK